MGFSNSMADSQDNNVYPPSVKQLFANNILKIYPPEQNLAEVIRAKRGISADQIDQIIFRYTLLLKAKVKSLSFRSLHSLRILFSRSHCSVWARDC
jgi:hypothetical protein